jgi:hypothetical protein
LTDELSEPCEARLDRLDLGGEWHVERPCMTLRRDTLSALEERTSGGLDVELVVGSRPPRRFQEPVQILAANEWPGVASLPEIVSLFVAPNAASVMGWLKHAKEFLAEWTGSPGLDGYQSKEEERVRKMAAAVYAAFQRSDITYVNPPASFEALGQKIRTPKQIAGASMGTCLDLAVLAAACLEQCGLHPLVILVEGHALAGVWLRNDRFPEPTQSEPMSILKRVELGEIAVFDPTAATSRETISFESAEQMAFRRISKVETFLVAVDVATSRQHVLLPLPTGDGEFVGAEAGAGREHVTSAPEARRDAAAARRVTVGGSGGGNDPVSVRLDRWRAKLLDLSLRNRMLNLKDGKAYLPLEVDDVHDLSDDFAAGTRFELHPAPTLTRTGQADDDAAIRKAYLQGERKAKHLRTTLTQQELDERVVHQWRQARLALEEGGANTFFVTAGEVEWYASKTSDTPRRAPILLLPAKLTRERAGAPYRVELLDEEPTINATMLQLLADDCGISVSGLDPLPVDGSGVDVELVLATFRQALRDQPGWRVRESAALGVFTFAKFLMWRDLTERLDELLQSPLVRHILQRAKLPDELCELPAASDDLGAALDPATVVCPLDADPTQMRAIVAAAGKTSFVLEGPPGTGKSQTITNLVVNCLAQGKQVLFVSEKIAALNVVKKRLTGVGLGAFCLELHSNKASKKDVLDQFKYTLAEAERRSPVQWEDHARQLRDARAELEGYVDALSAKHALGTSVYDVTAELIGLREVDPYPVTLPASAAAVTAAQIRSATEAVERFVAAARDVGSPAEHPLKELRIRWKPGAAEGLSAALEKTQLAAGNVRMALDSAQQVFGGTQPALSKRQIDVVHEAAGLIRGGPDIPAPQIQASPWKQSSQWRRTILFGTYSSHAATPADFGSRSPPSSTIWPWSHPVFIPSETRKRADLRWALSP